MMGIAVSYKYLTIIAIVCLTANRFNFNIFNITVDPNFQYGLEGNLNFKILLQQQQRHEAYTSKSLEQRFKTVSTKFNTSATIQPNKASHFIAYFTKNENSE